MFSWCFCKLWHHQGCVSEDNRVGKCTSVRKMCSWSGAEASVCPREGEEEEGGGEGSLKREHMPRPVGSPIVTMPRCHVTARRGRSRAQPVCFCLWHSDAEKQGHHHAGKMIEA